MTPSPISVTRPPTPSSAPSPLLPVALTIAGSDSSGGAGIQTDLRTFQAFGVYPTSAITAITSQNPSEVRRVDGLDPACVTAQMRAVLDVFSVCALKTGMLFSRPIIDAVAEVIESSCSAIPLVVDPVMVSTSRAKLLCDDALEALKCRLLPLADWITPNLPEAELLTGRALHTDADILDALREIADTFQSSVVLKGGHRSSINSADDLVFHNGRILRLKSPRLTLPPHADHGTGCTFSAALAALLARGEEPLPALRRAKAYVFGALSEAACLSKTDAPPIYGMIPPKRDAYDRVIQQEFLP